MMLHLDDGRPVPLSLLQRVLTSERDYLLAHRRRAEKEEELFLSGVHREPTPELLVKAEEACRVKYETAHRELEALLVAPVSTPLDDAKRAWESWTAEDVATELAALTLPEPRLTPETIDAILFDGADAKEELFKSVLVALKEALDLADEGTWHVTQVGTRERVATLRRAWFPEDTFNPAPVLEGRQNKL